MEMRVPDPLQQRVFERLRQARLRPTSARVCLLQILLAPPQAKLGAETIFQRLLSVDVSISLGTIYRVLKELEEHGLLAREWQTSTAGNKSLYLIRPEVAEVPPCQLVCATCRRRVAVRDAQLNQEIARVAASHGWAAGDCAVTLRCTACAAASGADANGYPPSMSV